MCIRNFIERYNNEVLNQPSTVFLMNVIYFFRFCRLSNSFLFFLLLSLSKGADAETAFRSYIVQPRHFIAPFEKSGRAKQRSQLYGVDRTFFLVPVVMCHVRVPCSRGLWWAQATMATMGHATQRGEKTALREAKKANERECKGAGIGIVSAWSLNWGSSRRTKRSEAGFTIRKREVSWIFAEWAVDQSAVALNLTMQSIEPASDGGSVIKEIFAVTYRDERHGCHKGRRKLLVRVQTLQTKDSDAS